MGMNHYVCVVDSAWYFVRFILMQISLCLTVRIRSLFKRSKQKYVNEKGTTLHMEHTMVIAHSLLLLWKTIMSLHPHVVKLYCYTFVGDFLGTKRS